MNFWRVPRRWAGEVIFIIAGGPSVAELDLERLRGRHVIVINNSFQRVPFADYLFFGDQRWWPVYRGRALEIFKGRIVTTSHSINHERVKVLRKIKPPPHLASNPSELAIASTNLAGGIGIAAHEGGAGATIVLVGADMKRSKDGRTHHHKPHPWVFVEGCWIDHMAHLRLMAAPLAAAGIKVINASLESKIDWWPKKPFEECLAL